LADLEAVLDAGRLPIVAVDSDELPAWEESDPNDGTSADDGASHALIVTGIDESTDTVTLNDSGLSAGGQGETLSVSQFEDAWQDSHYQMLV
jgi:hypothetical protein